MRGRPVVFIILAVAVVFSGLVARQFWIGKSLPRDQFLEKKLRVLTYSSFVGGSGPGGGLVAEFKKLCDCKVEILTAGDAGLILERLRLQQDSAPFDVVVGLDQISLTTARSMAWREIAMDRQIFSPIPQAHLEKTFVPYDWSPLTFIYRSSEVQPPARFEELVKSEYKNKFALQDPRSSSPGLQFVQWVRALKGEQTKDFLSSFKENVASVSPSWSFSYGLFKKNQASFVFSYVTSLAYHWGTEMDRSYKAVEFAEGHPVQVEFAAIPATCRECDLADRFVRFLLEPSSQRTIMERNFMFPARAQIAEGTVFAELPQLKERATPDQRDLADWLAVFK